MTRIIMPNSKREGKWILGSVLTLLFAMTLAACGGEDQAERAKQSGTSTGVNPQPQPDSAPQPPPDPITTPEILSFTSSSTAISAGENVTLAWEVEGADEIFVNPGIGRVQGSSVVNAPLQSTTFELRATRGTESRTETLAVVVLPSPSDWQVTETPPALVNPRLVDVSTVSPVQIVAFGVHCAGLIRQISLGNGDDALVYMSGDEPLRYPLRITGGRNVRVVGLHMELETQPGCGIGELPNVPANEHPNSNIHPRLPGGIAVRLQQSGISFVEGVYLDVAGHEADCFVSRNPDSMDNATARSQRDVIIQNTYCAGIEGLATTAIGGGVHGDLFQNQGDDNLRRVVFENVSLRTSQEGIVLHGWAETNGAVDLIVRRYDYTGDPRFIGDDVYESFGLAFAAFADNWTLDDVRIADPRVDPKNYGIINDQRYGNSPSANVQAHPQIRSGLPPEGAFALPQRTGLNYVSPHGGVPGK